MTPQEYRNKVDLKNNEKKKELSLAVAWKMGEGQKTYGWSKHTTYFDKDMIIRETKMVERAIYKGFDGLERKGIIERET